MLDDLVVVRQMVDVGHGVADDHEKRIDSAAQGPSTSDSMARMFRSLVDTTTVGCTSGVSCGDAGRESIWARHGSARRRCRSPAHDSRPETGCDAGGWEAREG